MMGLDRFLDAQKDSYEIALKEVKAGRKRSHWMWYIFPQITGLGYSSTAQYYAIKDLDEAIEYVEHPVLGKRLVEITEALLQVDNNDAEQVLGYPDHLKLKSSMTLFYLASGKDVFMRVLDKFFEGKMDQRTIKILQNKYKIHVFQFVMYSAATNVIDARRDKRLNGHQCLDYLVKRPLIIFLTPEHALRQCFVVTPLSLDSAQRSSVWF